jgi:hypothetical protein
MSTLILSVVLVFLWQYSIECIQPYFPSQIVFSYDNNRTRIAIDEINQRAYISMNVGATASETSYAMKHFPYALPDSPQSKYYVQLLVDTAPLGCMYGTYWTHGGNLFNSFPSHWLNGSSFEIKNYMEFNYNLIHSNDTSTMDDDYWYADVTCDADDGKSYPCEEIYFKKNTDIPLRSTHVVRRGWTVSQVTTYYQILSMGEPDRKYFDSIPTNWSLACRDVMLGIYLNPSSTTIAINQSSSVEIWLPTAPHRIDDNDTVTIRWQQTGSCTDCLSLTPEQLEFNGENFQVKQTLTITRHRSSSSVSLIPRFSGGGFDVVPTSIFPIYVR